MRHAQRQGPAASGVDANFIHFFRHVPTFSWIYSAAFCRNITPRKHANGAPAPCSMALIPIKVASATAA